MNDASERLALLASASAYLPRWIIETALEGGPLREARILDASVLLVDMAGFTTLTTTTLAEQGEAGTEEVFERLDAWFEAVLAPILESHGDVVAFGGDCCTALFDGPDAATRLELASEVAARILRDSPIPVRIGLADGAVSLATVGTERRRQPVTLGLAARAAATAMDIASKGEAWAPVANSELSVTDAGEGFGPISLPSVGPAARSGPVDRGGPEVTQLPRVPRDQEEAAEAQIRTFFAPAIWDALLLPTELGEHRTVTSLFARLEKTEATDPGFLAVEASLDQAAGIIERQGGYLQKVESADKGTLVVAFFGLPTALPDPARRALMAARGLTARGTFTASLTTGRVFAGVLGSRMRHEHTAIGAPVNLAARLLQAAEPGTLICDPNTASALEDLSFESLPAVKAKGFAEPQPALRPVVRVGRLASYEDEERTAMVGRREFLSRMSSWLEDPSSEPRTLVGPTGIGKSRLVRETARIAVAVGLTPVLGHFGGSESDGAFRELASALGGPPGGQPSEDALADLSAAAETAGAASTLLILEDLHLATRDEQRSVIHLSGLAQRLGFLLLATSRDPKISLGSPEEVQPLPELQASELAQRVDPSLGEGPALLIAQRSRGNPLFVEALTRHRGAEDRSLPPSLEAALRLRQDGLSPVERRVLLAASVLGMHVEPELLSRVVEGVPGAAVAGALEHLHQLGFLDRVGEHLRFSHDLEQHTAYQTLPFRARQSLHLRVLRELEARPEVSPEAILGHLEAAGQTDRIAQVALDAAWAASNQGASGRCLEISALGLAHTEDAELRCRLEAVRVRGLALALDREAALELADRVVATARRLRLPEIEGALLYELASIRSRLAHYSESDEDVSQGLLLAGAAGDRQLQAKLMMVRGWNAWGRGLYPDARQYLEAALAVQSETAPMGIRSGLATVQIQLGNFEEALALLPPLEETAGSARVATAFDRGLVAYHRAQPHLVSQYLDAARQAALASGDTRFTADLSARVAALHEMQGRWSEGGSLRKRTIDAYRGVGMRYEAVGCDLDGAVELLVSGRLLDLERRIEGIRIEAEEVEAGDEVARAEVLGACCQLLLGRQGRSPQSVLDLNWRHARRSGRWRLEVELRGLDALASSVGERLASFERGLAACRDRGDRSAERFLLLLALQEARLGGRTAAAEAFDRRLREALTAWGCPRWHHAA